MSASLEIASPRFFWQPWLTGAGLLLLVFLAYFPLVRAGYIWDDDYYVYKNAALRTVSGLWQIWNSPFHPVTPQYYPLTFTTFWLEYHLWGDRPLGYHIVNVALHALSSIMIWRLLRGLRVPGAWLAAAVFALHPVHVESVAWISERKNVLSGLLFLLSIYAYLRWRGEPLIFRPAIGERMESAGAGRLGPKNEGRIPLHSQNTGPTEALNSRWWYVLSLLLFLLALLSKTVTASLPAVILLITYWKRGVIRRRDALPLAPYFVFGAALGSLTSWLERHHVGADGPEWQFSFLQRMLIAGRSIWFYAGKIFWPDPLIFVYPRWVIDTHRPLHFLFLAGAIAVPVALWIRRNRQGRGPLAAVLFFGGCLVPALGFANVYPMRFSFVADHFQYLASIGLIALAVAAGASLLRRIAPGQTTPGLVLASGLLVILATMTFLRTAPFRSAKLLWTDTTEKNHGAWMAYNNLANVLMREKDYAGARKALDAALAVEPHYTYSRLNRVILELLIDNDPASKLKPGSGHAIAEARAALANVAQDQSPLGKAEQSACWHLLGDVFFARRDGAAAQDAFAHLVDLDPDDLVARLDLARMMFVRNQGAAAEPHFRRVLDADPSNVEARRYLARILFNRHDDAAARTALEPLLSLDANDSAVHWELAQILERSNDFAGALAQWQQVIRINPASAQAHAHSALLEARTGDKENAEKELSLARKLDPHYLMFTLTTPLKS